MPTVTLSPTPMAGAHAAAAAAWILQVKICPVRPVETKAFEA
jgi:hypothetical protein